VFNISTRGSALPSVVPGEFREIDERLLQVAAVLGLFQAFLEAWPLSEECTSRFSGTLNRISWPPPYSAMEQTTEE
jgi:hypothetical protein